MPAWCRGRSRCMNLAHSLLYAAERTPDAEAVVQGDDRFTYAQLLDRVARLPAGSDAGHVATASPRSSAAGTSRCSSTGPASGSARHSFPLSPRVVGGRPRLLPRGLRRPLFLEADADARPAARRRAPRRARRRDDDESLMLYTSGRPAARRASRARTAPTAPAASRRSSTRATATATGRSAACRSTTRWACTP